MSNPYHRPNPYNGPPQNPYAEGPQGYGYPQGQGQPPLAGYGCPRTPVPYPARPPHGAGPTGAQNNLAMVSVILGFISVVGSFMCYLGVIGAVGIGFGVAALKKARETGTGRNAAVGGIVLSVLGLLVTTTLVVGLVISVRKSV